MYVGKGKYIEDKKGIAGNTGREADNLSGTPSSYLHVLAVRATMSPIA